jgi:hypothetical protein
MIAPLGICRGTATARASAVNDIVMNQRGTVEKFDNSSESNRAAVFAARVTRRKKQEGGTQPLPTPTEQVRGDFRDSRKRRITLPREFLLDLNEVVADQIKYLFDRQQRDGVSPA